MLVKRTNLEVFTSKFVGTGPSSYKKGIYRAAVSQSLRNTGVAYYTPRLYGIAQRFSNIFQVGTTFISQNVLRITLPLGLSNSLGLP